MGHLTSLLFISLFILSTATAFSQYKNKNYLTALLCFSFSLKVVLFFVMESGLKYSFVLDSLKYEMDAWNLMKAEVSDTKYVLEAFEKAEYLNPFTSIMLNVFYVFGKVPQIVTLLNMFFSIGIYFFCINIAALLMENVHSLQKNKSILLLSFVLLFYPSLNIWSVTNTKDPAALFFLLLGIYLLIYLKRNRNSIHQIILWSLGISALASIYLSHLFRPYILPILGAGFALSFLMLWLKKKLNLSTTLTLMAFLFVTLLLLIEHTQPEVFQDISKNIYKTRAGFLNEDWIDDQSKSAFLVNYAFSSTQDYLLFIPQAIAHYFFGPFIWEISSLTEAFGLLEVFFILSLLKPFFKGVRILNRQNSLEFNFLLSVMILLSLSQSFMVANMGTIFRHRTLSILIYMIIATVGFHFDKKEFKNS